MKIGKAHVALGRSNFARVDVIEFQDTLWLVPEWLEQARGRARSPARIIGLKSRPRAHLAAGLASFPSRASIPIEVFEGQVEPAPDSEFVVIANPPIRICDDATGGG